MEPRLLSSNGYCVLSYFLQYRKYKGRRHIVVVVDQNPHRNSGRVEDDYLGLRRQPTQ